MFGETQFRVSEDYEAVPFEEQLSTLMQLQEEGKVASVGLSNETAYGITVAGLLHRKFPGSFPCIDVV